MSVRATNALIAANYDAVVFDEAANARLDPERILGLAALNGLRPGCVDVLDLGCGAGAQLERLAGQVSGRLVGTDISREACRRTQARLSPFGDRVRIVCADLLDLSAADLGRFDLIYNIGVLYITPPEVRRHVLDLIAACLRPGGVAVISYFAGSVPLLRASIHRTLRAHARSAATPENAVWMVREKLETLMSSIDPGDPDQALVASALRITAAQSDAVLFHEVCNHAFDALHTGELEQLLAERGVSFLDYIAATGAAGAPTSHARAMAVDRLDLARGGYHYAVFAKGSDADLAFDPLAPAIVWTTPVRRLNANAPYDEHGAYQAPGSDVEVGVILALSQAILEVLMVAPATWNDAVALATARLLELGLSVSPDDEAAARADLLDLWRHRAVWPLYRPAA